MRYPAEATAPADKLEFCLNAQEKLRILHNAKGKDFLDGKITRKEFDDYVRDQHGPKQRAISSELGMLRDGMKKSQRFDADLDNLE